MFELNVDDEITIRSIDPNNARALFRIVDPNREHIGQFLPWANKTWSVDDSRGFLERFVTGMQAGVVVGGGIYFHGKLCGYIDINLAATSERRAGEIGYWLARDASGHGVMTRCVGALREWAWRETSLAELYIRTRTDNNRSAAVAQRAGFEFDDFEPASTDPRRGDPHPHNRYILHRPTT